ncbi:DUF2156 domain-containing protein [Rhodobium gokarnense]|uniref:Phosphatidylglycerol lysyltransferase C-terminal domain-containing protein n=1 Tax=Rhodobium gokarnense TaxID=364296 RepID=A0ABT3HEN0_9HYPH|nr:DUF2156 domain-containing protein [Rhodobium gokarnense]MCW2308850.1 hypothetical protein [Rhodobium gokarnense]
MLSSILRHVERDDPFGRSAAYFAMTGRKGLWAYGDDETMMLVARHPNRDDILLLFPPIGRDPAGLLARAVDDPLSLPSGRLELARFSTEDQALASRLGTMGVKEPHREKVLDWAYPVHVVSPKRIVEREGKPFVSFRGHINRAIRDGCRAEPIDLARHRDDILRIIDRWADSRSDSDFSHDDLTGPTHSVLGLMDRTDLDIGGTISCDSHGAPIGFWLWEQVGNTAMSLVRAYLRHPGNAEYGILSMAEQLSNANIPEMCLGGSETADLDAFKRKMQPVRSIDLSTVALPDRTLAAGIGRYPVPLFPARV